MHLLVILLCQRQLSVHRSPISSCEGSAGRDVDRQKCHATVARPVKFNTSCFQLCQKQREKQVKIPDHFANIKSRLLRTDSIKIIPERRALLTTTTPPQQTTPGGNVNGSISHSEREWCPRKPDWHLHESPGYLREPGKTQSTTALHKGKKMNILLQMFQSGFPGVRLRWKSWSEWGERLKLWNEWGALPSPMWKTKKPIAAADTLGVFICKKTEGTSTF